MIFKLSRRTPKHNLVCLVECKDGKCSRMFKIPMTETIQALFGESLTEIFVRARIDSTGQLIVAGPAPKQEW